jgi:Xaa-Pro aminopeptidase
MFDYQRRRDSLWQNVQALPAQGILITDEVNVRYLTGFSGDSTYLLVSDQGHCLISDSRYDTQIAAECPDLELVTRTAAQEMKSLVGQTLRRFALGIVAIEADALSKAAYDGLVSQAEGVRFVDTVGLVLAQRAIKDEQEIELIRQSIRIAEAAFLDLVAELRADWTEQQTAYGLEERIRSRGGEGRAFDTIIAGGARAALPHAGVSPRRLGESQSILVDWGAKYRGYCSDLTRVLVVGQPSETLVEIHQVVCRAQERAIAAIRPGVKLKEIDELARRTIAESGFGAYFGHGLGHGFGLQIHESPRLSPLATDSLQAGMIVTVEPGIYLPGDCGVRIEDDVLVTDSGCEVLSNLPRSLDDNQVALR